MNIRLAYSHEASICSELAFRSKSYWPYDKSLLEDYRSELEVFTEDIIAESVYVGTINEKIIGFYALSSDLKKQRLHFLFVEPSFIGLGYGKVLWKHAVSVAQKRKWQYFSFYADAYAAENFYNYQRCEIIGSLESKLGLMTELRFKF